MSAQLQKAAEGFEKLNPREQRLAIAVAALVALFAVFGIVRYALESLAMLDSQINRLQQTLLNVDNQIRHRESIEEQYARVASQHSSKWSAAEIHDRLRAEIYRLAQVQPPALNADGVPEKVTNSTGELVSIPAIQEGNLTQGEQGYREYNLNFTVPAAPLQNMLDFIDRLQNSPQSLRVDIIELTRDALDDKVTANLTITRTVVAGVAEDPKATPAVAKSAAKAIAKPAEKGMRLNAGDWKCEDCEVSAEPAKGEAAAIIITPKGEKAQAYLERAMPPGIYEVALEVAAQGPARLAVAEDGKELSGAKELPGDGAPLRCVFQFQPSGKERVQLRLPLLTMEGKDAVLRVTHLAIKKVEG